VSEIDEIRELTPEQESSEGTLDLRFTGARHPMSKAGGRQLACLVAHLQRDGGTLGGSEPPERGELDLVRCP
jgi:hypothetical protein